MFIRRVLQAIEVMFRIAVVFRSWIPWSDFSKNKMSRKNVYFDVPLHLTVKDCKQSSKKTNKN